MNDLLRADRERISEILQHTTSLADRYLKEQDQIPPGRFIADLPFSQLPEKGIGARGALDFFDKHYAHLTAATAGPRYFGFVIGGSTPASIAGDWLVSAFDQNVYGSNDSIAPQLEHQTIDLMRQLFGLDGAYYGSFVTGATMSNFVSLAIARQWIGEQLGVDVSHEGSGNVPVRIISGTPHSSILKSLSMLGIGRNAVVKPDTLPEREAVDLKHLEEILQAQQGPVIVVANAGTVNTVDFDDLEKIGQLKSKYTFWMHVDAAFGGFAALSDKFRHLVKGINHADSITIDAHKWLNVPYDSAMQFTRHRPLQLKVFQNSGAYLTDPAKSPDYFHYTPESSRRWRSLPAWFSLMAYGKEGHREIVERNCANAALFGESISRSGQFRLLAPVRMNVVCFTLTDSGISLEAIQRFLAIVRDDGRVFFTPTVYKGIPAIRAAVSNWQTEQEDMEIALTALKDAYNKVQSVSV
jgi:glutamate/tyrosine decarboxylase-like PLP-dependent enzyme